MKVIICEDDKRIMNLIKKTIENFIMIHELDASVAFANDDPDKILEYLKNNELDNCYFLDIDLGPERMSGIELGVKIRGVDPFSKIIYVTSHDEFIKNIIDETIEPFAYIVKDSKSLEDDLRKVFEKAYSQYLLKLKKDPDADKVPIKVGAKQMLLPIEEILFFETLGNHKVLLKTIDGNELQFFGTLSEIEKLHSSFFYCHRSYVVNMENIRSYSKGKIIFQNNVEYVFPDTAVRKIRKKLKKKNK